MLRNTLRVLVLGFEVVQDFLILALFISHPPVGIRNGDGRVHQLLVGLFRLSRNGSVPTGWSDTRIDHTILFTAGNRKIGHCQGRRISSRKMLDSPEESFRLGADACRSPRREAGTREEATEWTTTQAKRRANRKRDNNYKCREGATAKEAQDHDRTNRQMMSIWPLGIGHREASIGYTVMVAEERLTPRTGKGLMTPET